MTYKISMPQWLQPFACDDLERLGQSNDGGYLVSLHDVAKSSKLISLGIGEDWSFEQQFLQRRDVPLEAYDGSLDPNVEEISQFFQGTKKLIPSHVGQRPDDVAELLTQPNLFLKCDVDGAEYRILDQLISKSSLFTGMVIEFHGITNQNNWQALINFVSKVQQKLVHVHINNWFYYKTPQGPVPDILELTFSSNPLIRYDPPLTLPHPLDMSNNPNGRDFSVKFDW